MACKAAHCKNKTFSRARFCPTHIHRKKKGLPFGAPIKYLQHGKTKTLTYRTWAMMKNRCLNPKATDWKYYGGRGIKICKRWFSFKNFLEDMGPRPRKNLTLDRINNDKGYTLSNCRWATKKQQRENQRQR